MNRVYEERRDTAAMRETLNKNHRDKSTCVSFRIHFFVYLSAHCAASGELRWAASCLSGLFTHRGAGGASFRAVGAPKGSGYLVSRNPPCGLDTTFSFFVLALLVKWNYTCPFSLDNHDGRSREASEPQTSTNVVRLESFIPTGATEHVRAAHCVDR